MIDRLFENKLELSNVIRNALNGLLPFCFLATRNVATSSWSDRLWLSTVNTSIVFRRRRFRRHRQHNHDHRAIIGNTT